MKKLLSMTLIFTMVFSMEMCNTVFARPGDGGYEGGISTGFVEDIDGKTKTTYKMDYQEISFVTGEPVVYKGTLELKKSLKQGKVTSTYKYNLSNAEKDATLTRTLNFSTRVTKASNGQTIEETGITGTPSEIIRIGGNTYTLRSYEFSRSNIIDPKPSINYFVGDMRGMKTYQVGTAGDATVTIEATGNYYGYDQYWGNAEAQIFDYVILSQETVDGNTQSWGGTASVNISSTSSKQLKYSENEPQAISFEGGYIQSQYNSSIMEYTSSLPEFDSQGVATDHIIDTRDSLMLENLPQQKRLPVPDLSHLRGHWAENDIRALYSLEVFKDDSTSFNPEEYMTKAEFIVAMVEAAKEVPPDPALVSRTTTPASRGRNQKTTVVSPFTDVATDDKYFPQIESAYKRGIIGGKGDGTFGADDYLNIADAITVFIKAMGLESLAPGAMPVTTFRDNDDIPSYARRGAYVAQRIGLVKGDTRGYLNPGQRLTKAQGAAMINRFIAYMREDIKKDYRERILGYN